MEKILIQEADESIRDVLNLSLKADGFHVVIIKDCNKKLLRLVKRVKPNLLVLDFRLNGSDSISMCRMVKNSYPKLPVIAFSCNDNIEKIYAKYGFDGYIAKPFDLDVLSQTLKSILIKTLCNNNMILPSTS